MTLNKYDFNTNVSNYIRNSNTYLVTSNQVCIERKLDIRYLKKSNEKYQNRKIKSSFGRTIQSLSKRKQENLKIYTKRILSIK